MIVEEHERNAGCAGVFHLRVSCGQCVEITGLNVSTEMLLIGTLILATTQGPFLVCLMSQTAL